MRRLKWIAPIDYLLSALLYEDLDTKETLTLSEMKLIPFCMIEYLFETSYVKSGKNHREDGPATIIYSNEQKKEIVGQEFCLEGFTYEENDWFKLISKENRIKYLFNMVLP